MSDTFHENKNFSDISYYGKSITNREFLNCNFSNCDLSSSDFSSSEFSSCVFTNCNLSLLVLEDVALNDVKFIDCKMTGIDFSVCNKYIFTVEFVNSYLDLSSFYGMKVIQTKFTECSLKEVDFEEADFRESMFINCDFMRSNFMHTILEKCDFRTSYDFSIDPATNRIRKAKFSKSEIMGLLDSYQIIVEP